MYTGKHENRKTFLFDRPGYYRLYLNEVAGVEVEIPTFEGEEETQTVTGYSYTGTEPDGSTVIPAAAPTYADFVAGLIRLRYTVADELALHANMRYTADNPESSNAEKYRAEWNEFQKYRAECKDTVRAFFPEP